MLASVWVLASGSARSAVLAACAVVTPVPAPQLYEVHHGKMCDELYC